MVCLADNKASIETVSLSFFSLLHNWNPSHDFQHVKVNAQIVIPILKDQTVVITQI